MSADHEEPRRRVPFAFAKKEKPKTDDKSGKRPIKTRTVTKVARETTDAD